MRQLVLKQVLVVAPASAAAPVRVPAATAAGLGISAVVIVFAGVWPARVVELLFAP